MSYQATEYKVAKKCDGYAKICGEVRLVSNDTQLFITNNNIIWGNLFKNFVQILD